MQQMYNMTFSRIKRNKTKAIPTKGAATGITGISSSWQAAGDIDITMEWHMASRSTVTAAWQADAKAKPADTTSSDTYTVAASAAFGQGGNQGLLLRVIWSSVRFPMSLC